jgi:glycogen operon protein
VDDIAWFTPAGVPMTQQDWQAGALRSVAVFLNGQAIPTPNERGETVVDDSFLVVFNADPNPAQLTVPGQPWGQRWRRLLYTVEPGPDAEGPVWGAGDTVPVEARSVVLLRREL